MVMMVEMLSLLSVASSLRQEAKAITLILPRLRARAPPRRNRASSVAVWAVSPSCRGRMEETTFIGSQPDEPIVSPRPKWAVKSPTIHFLMAPLPLPIRKSE